MITDDKPTWFGFDTVHTSSHAQDTGGQVMERDVEGEEVEPCLRWRFHPKVKAQMKNCRTPCVNETGGAPDGILMC